MCQNLQLGYYFSGKSFFVQHQPSSSVWIDQDVFLCQRGWDVKKGCYDQDRLLEADQILTKEKKYNKIGFIFLLISFLCIYNLRINSDDDYSFCLFVVVICISTDIGGYVFGKLFKGPKLTKLSPNKTFTGVLGSFIFLLVKIDVSLATPK